MNIFQLSCFLAVSETLNFARAAEQLHVTQPAITQQIHSLEKELNVKLFKRSTRMVKMTKEGMLFLNDARHMVEISQRAKKRFENPYQQDIQIFSLGCCNYAQLFLLSPILKKLGTEYKNLHPRLNIAPFQQLYRLLEDDELDVVLGFREASTKKSNILYKELKKVQAVCICSMEHPLSRCECVGMEELKKEKLIIVAPGKMQSDFVRLQGQLMDGRSPSDFYFCESVEGAIVLAQSGFGVLILSGLFISKDLPLAQIPIQGVEPISFGMYYKSMQGNVILKSLVQIIKQ